MITIELPRYPMDADLTLYWPRVRECWQEKRMELIDCTYRLPPELLKLLRAQSEDMGISQQEFVRQALWAAVAQPRKDGRPKERRFNAVLDARGIEELDRTGKITIRGD